MRITLDRMDGKGVIEFDELPYEEAKLQLSFMVLFAMIASLTKYEHQLEKDDYNFFVYVTELYMKNKIIEIPKDLTDKQKLKLWMLVKKYYWIVK